MLVCKSKNLRENLGVQNGGRGVITSPGTCTNKICAQKTPRLSLEKHQICFEEQIFAPIRGKLQLQTFYMCVARWLPVN